MKNKEKDMAKQKYYVVWSGKKPGIYTSWETCKQQVHGFKGAKYKSFPTREVAERAFKNGPAQSKRVVANKRSVRGHLVADQYIEHSISVDAACSGNPGDMEYRGVNTKDGEELFHHGPVANGTNNIGEFLAIVHALALLKQKGETIPIYSDSATAISWVRNKRVNTTIQRTESTEAVWRLIDRALTWLDNNTYSNKLLKWETREWGEIKADFGRK